MARNPRAWSRSLSVLVLALAASARAQVVTVDGSPGLYGTPYAYFGPAGSRVYEEYRKHAGMLGAQYPSISVDNVAPDHALFHHIFAGATDATHDAYSSEGILVGTSYSKRSYPDAALSLVRGSNPTQLNGADVRAGFMEHLADGGGPSFATFVQLGGGENGFSDPYRAQWGVDGLYIFFSLQYGATNWKLVNPLATHAGPDSSGEPSRTNFWSQVVVAGATGTASELDTPYPNSMAIDVRWELVQSGAVTSLVVQVGPSVTLTWPFDDGVTRHGLTQPGNPDGKPYQNGGLDLEHVVPFSFLGSSLQASTQPFPDSQLEIALTGSHLALTGYPARAEAGVSESFTVTALDATGEVDTGYAGTVHLLASDPEAIVPQDYTFTPGDRGVHAFPATFSHLGTQSLTVQSAFTPSIASTQGDIEIVSHLLEVGFNCASATGPAAPALGLALSWILLRGVRRRPRST